MPDIAPVPATPASPAPRGTAPPWNSWGRIKDFLVIAVIPLALWGVKLEIGNALRDERITQLQTEQQGVKQLVQENSIKLARMEGKIDTLNAKIEALSDLLKSQ